MSRKLLIIIFLCLPPVFLAIKAVYRTYFWPFFVQDGQIVTLQLRSHLLAPVSSEVVVEVVKSSATLSRGLSGRSQLLSRYGQQIDGLLFIFKNEQKQFFWMKEMFFDIDICWLQDRNLHSCQKALSPDDFNLPLSTLPIYASVVPVDLVLETKVDFFNEADFGKHFFAK